MSLDVRKLKNIKPSRIDDAAWAQCPACIEEGYDQLRENYLTVFGNRVYGCVRYPKRPGLGSDYEKKRAAHRQRIHELAGEDPPAYSVAGAGKAVVSRPKHLAFGQVSESAPKTNGKPSTPAAPNGMEVAV